MHLLLRRYILQIQSNAISDSGVYDVRFSGVG